MVDELQKVYSALGAVRESMNNIVIFESSDQLAQVRLEGETVWLSLQQLAELFGRDKSVISRHLRNIYVTEELTREATVAKNATIQMEGSREVQREIEYYNLDAIISVDYRVNSSRATGVLRIKETEKFIECVEFTERQCNRSVL